MCPLLRLRLADAVHGSRRAWRDLDPHGDTDDDLRGYRPSVSTKHSTVTNLDNNAGHHRIVDHDVDHITKTEFSPSFIEHLALSNFFPAFVDAVFLVEVSEPTTLRTGIVFRDRAEMIV
jgi:hypothetical protein